MSIMEEETFKAGLIGTKYSTPEMNPYLVSRRRLHRKLDHALKCRFTLVTAPAGYGKTTAVLDWLSTCGLPSAWLSLDPGDNDPATFWRYVCAALDGVFIGVSKDTEYVFSSYELLKANIHLNILIDQLSKVGSDFLLVLDDVHMISEPSIWAGLNYLIDYLPANMHLIFISRTEPGIELPKQRLKWQVRRLSEEDLRFDEEEITRFYQARGYTLDNEDLNKVMTYSEGWAAALVAVSMSMEESDGKNDAIAALARSSRDIEEYLKEELIRTWTLEKLSFAMKTSILDTLSEAICDAVTGAGNAGRMLREIRAGSGFLTALDDQGQEYRYHYLFRNLLYKLLFESAPNELPGLHKKAAFWCREHGFLYDAVEHLLSGGLFPEAFEVIEHDIDHLIHRNDFGTLLSWVERMPAEYRDKGFKIAVIYAMYYAEIGRFDLARQWVARMKVQKDSDPYAAEPETSEFIRAAGTLVEANLLIREGNAEYLPLLFGAAETNANGAYRMPEYNDFNTADIYFYRCPINLLIGLIKEAPDKYEKMVENYRGMISKNPGYAPLCTGEYFYESNRLDEALPYLLKAIEEAGEAGCPGTLVPAMADIARIKRAQGDMEGAFRVIGECEERLRQYNKAHWVYLIQAFRCRLCLDIGDMEKAREWQTSGKLSLFAEINKIREFELIVYARALMSLNRTDDASLLLQRLLAFTGGSRRLHSRVEVLNLLSLLAFQKNSTRLAFKYLDESLDIGMREGFVRSYLDELFPMARMLRSYTKSGGKRTGDSKERRAYAGSLLKQMPESLLKTLEARDVVAEGVTGRIFEQLTAQERKVLELMANAATNREIGEQLGISLRTVKAHTGNIYGKLGLKNRAQCVKLIRELGLR